MASNQTESHYNIFQLLQHEKGEVMNSKTCSSGPQHLIEIQNYTVMNIFE